MRSFTSFLPRTEFAARFAPADADVAKVIAALAKYGLTAQQTTATTLKVTGLPADMERAFSVSLHSYEVPAHGNVPGYTYHAPLSSPTVPAEISVPVAGILGLDTRPSLHPLHHLAPAPLRKSAVASPLTGDPFGQLTVTDFASYYDVNPLYNRGVTGKGRTLGIMTFASFTPSDAFAYWRARRVGGQSEPDPHCQRGWRAWCAQRRVGFDETSLDVEQSGGIAPGANIIVYQAPNTNQGFSRHFCRGCGQQCGAEPLDQLGLLGVVSEPGEFPRDRPDYRTDGGHYASDPRTSRCAPPSRDRRFSRRQATAAPTTRTTILASAPPRWLQQSAQRRLSGERPGDYGGGRNDAPRRPGVLPECGVHSTLLHRRHPAREGVGMGLPGGLVHGAWAQSHHVRNLPRRRRRRREHHV